MKDSIYLASSRPRVLVTIKFLLMMTILRTTLPNLAAQIPDCGNLPSFPIHLNNQTIANATVYNTQNIRISGTVNFNASVSMFGCTVLMDPNATLNVNAGMFTARNNANGTQTVFFGCTSMWNTINIHNSAGIDMRNCIVQDAQRALTFFNNFDNAGSIIQDNLFRRNLVSIGATNVLNLTFTTFSGNTFTGIAPVQHGIPALPPFNLTTGNMTGIVLSTATGTLGTAGLVNTFQFLGTGIRMTNRSVITVNNCNFTDQRISGQVSSINGGTGIYSERSFLTIQHIFSGDASCTFTRNGSGIVSSRTAGLTVRNAIFNQQSFTDIEVRSSTINHTVEITDNTMNLGIITGQSIFYNRAGQTGLVHSRIINNAINLPAQTAGRIPSNIRLINVNTQPGAFDQSIIADNELICSYGNPTVGNPVSIDGIWVSGTADRYQISGNTISYVAAGPPRTDVFGVGIGMVTNDGQGNIIGPNNTINTNNFGLNDGTDAWFRCGIHTDRSQNTWVCKNNINNPRNGYHFIGNCLNGEWGRNIIGYANFGLAMHDIQYPNQQYRMNEWQSGFYNNHSVLIEGTANLPWRVDPNIPFNVAPTGLFPALPPYVEVGGLVFQSFIQNGGVSQSFCEGVLPPTGGFEDPPTDEHAENYVHGSYTFGNTTIKKDFERDLLFQMIRFPNSFINNATAQEYYDENEGNTFWNFAQAEWLLHDANYISQTDQSELDNLHTAIREIVDSLTQIEILEGQNLNSTEPTLQTSKTQLLAQLATLNSEMETLQTEIETERLVKLETAQNFINDLSENEDWESNFKTIFYLKAKQSANEDWTSGDTILLRNIAYSCEETGGKAVTIAREMLPAPESYSFVRELADPNCGGSKPAAESEIQTNLEVLLKPNPANDRMLVELPLAFTGVLEVLNAAGIRVFSRQLDAAKDFEISTANFPTGLYFLRLKTETASAGAIKFIVSH